MMDNTALHSAIKKNVDKILDEKRVTVSNVTAVSSDGKLTIVEQGKKVLPSTIDAEDTLIDAICKAVAEEVIKHIQEKLELKAGMVTTATLPFTAPLSGAGGGVPGPVVIPGQPIVVAGGTIDIAQGTFQ